MRFCLCAQPEIIDEAADGTTAVELARQLAPDVITMAIGLPDVNGLDVTRKLTQEMSQIKLVIVSAHGKREYREAAVEAGAVSFVDKMYLMEELPRCLDRLVVTWSA